MKLIPDAVVRTIASKGLLASDKAPKVLFVGGVVGMVGSTVLACHATLKVEDVLDGIEADKAKARNVKALVESDQYTGSQTYSDHEFRRDLAVISTRGVGSLIKLYAPSVVLGAVSIAALTKSHNLLQDRNVALTAAYVAVDGAFQRYRDRVIDRYGEEADRELRYETEEIEVLDEETGKLVTTTRITGAPGSPYSRFYAEWSSRNWSPDPDINLLFLTSQQNYWNDKLRVRGHVFLNEVYDSLGLAHTKAGAAVGWRWGKDSGDDQIDFGFLDGVNEAVNEFFHGNEGEILLDFNVDGPIWDKIDDQPVIDQFMYRELPKGDA
jgi:hypothetical protein